MPQILQLLFVIAFFESILSFEYYLQKVLCHYWPSNYYITSFCYRHLIIATFPQL